MLKVSSGRLRASRSPSALRSGLFSLTGWLSLQAPACPDARPPTPATLVVTDWLTFSSPPYDAAGVALSDQEVLLSDSLLA